MIFLLLIKTYQAFRMIYLKNTENMFLTNIKNNLCLEKSTLDNIKWQNVVVHKRKLFFVTDSVYYTVAMSYKDIHVRIVEVKSFQEKRIGMYQTKKIVDLFGLNKKEESNANNGGGNGGGSGGNGSGSNNPGANPGSNSNPNPGANHNSIFNPTPSSNTNSIPGSVFNTNLGSNDSQRSITTQRTNNRLFSLNSNNMRPPAVPTITSYTQITKTKEKKPSQPKDNDENDEEDRNDRRLKQRKKKKLREDFHVDSDSSLEEYENGCVYKDAKIKEVDGKYFQLVVNEEFCVTRFEGKFIFAPCSENDGQYFSMARGNEILTQLKKQKENEMFLEVSKVGLLDNVDRNVERFNDFIKSKNLSDLIGKTDTLNLLKNQLLRNSNSLPNNLPNNTNSLRNNLPDTTDRSLSTDDLLRSANTLSDNTDSITRPNTPPDITDRNIYTEERSGDDTKNKMSLQNTQRLKQLLKTVNPDISDEVLNKILKINKNEPERQPEGEKENTFGFINNHNNEKINSYSEISNIKKDGNEITESIFNKESTINNKFTDRTGNSDDKTGKFDSYKINTGTDFVYPYNNSQPRNTTTPTYYNSLYKLPDKEITKEVKNKETVKFKLKDLSKRPSFYTTQKIEGKPMDTKPNNSAPLNLSKLITSPQKSLKNTEFSKNKTNIISNSYNKDKSKSNIVSDDFDSTFGNLKEDIAKTESMFGNLRSDTLEGSSDKEDFISKLQKTFKENSF
ncbi:hypothetical protein CWI36_0654p0020 [Hamiltosporidium magnivora]|uniref:Uncharacterized protein n=2 Tax=Hamiltosporidium magnivora TaxID=148818 RepID=A0A4Q9LEK1_9MICR|nr:hypothetical protein CWI36_0654p0020 [Hamiltosporidium magnivora]